jgi:hypothetical protein
MVLIGHSQSGLLVKMTAVDTGTRPASQGARPAFSEI